MRLPTLTLFWMPCLNTPETKVIATTFGRYRRYGSKLVAACAPTGEHCCDQTCESLCVRERIDKSDAEAERTGAKSVPSCGFDSIPAVRIVESGIHLWGEGEHMGRGEAFVVVLILLARSNKSIERESSDNGDYNNTVTGKALRTVIFGCGPQHLSQCYKQ